MFSSDCWAPPGRHRLAKRVRRAASRRRRQPRWPIRQRLDQSRAAPSRSRPFDRTRPARALGEAVEHRQPAVRLGQGRPQRPAPRPSATSRGSPASMAFRSARVAFCPARRSGGPAVVGGDRSSARTRGSASRRHHRRGRARPIDVPACQRLFPPAPPPRPFHQGEIRRRPDRPVLHEPPQVLGQARRPSRTGPPGPPRWPWRRSSPGPGWAAPSEPQSSSSPPARRAAPAPSSACTVWTTQPRTPVVAMRPACSRAIARPRL